MQTITLPDNFPKPKYQFSQKVLARCEHMPTNDPIQGTVIGLFFIDPDSVDYRSPGWNYHVSFALDLPEGVDELLSEPSGIAREFDVQAV
jgi:hypothetical protein